MTSCFPRFHVIGDVVPEICHNSSSQLYIYEIAIN